jgi:hypothetical protein
MLMEVEEPDASSNPVVTDAPVLVKVAGAMVYGQLLRIVNTVERTP